MAIGVIILSHNQRKKVNIIFYVLNGIQIFLAVVIIISAMYIEFGVAQSLYSEKSEVDFVFVVLILFGLNVVSHYLLGMKISYKCFKQAHKKSTRGMLFLWICAGVFLMINLIILAAMSKRIGHHISRSMKYSFRYGMQHYLTNEKWKQAIDTFQYKFSCCGLESYEDWHEVNWLTKYHISETTDLAKKFLNPETKAYRVEPWSCCRLDFPLQCFHDPFQQVHSDQIWENEPKVVDESINTIGCLDIIEQPIFSAINLFIILVVFLCLINLIIFILSRYLYTATRNALILDDPQGLAPGWIFGRGDCGYTRGKSLHEIMTSKEKFRFKDKMKGSGKKKRERDPYRDMRLCSCGGYEADLICECDESTKRLCYCAGYENDLICECDESTGNTLTP